MDSKSGKKQTGYVPQSAERKLEKQISAMRANMHLISAEPTNWTVKENTALGVHFVLILADTKSGFTKQLVVHRPIGYDYSLGSGSWVMSDAADIPQFLSTKTFPGEKKVLEKLAAFRENLGIEAKVLVKVGNEVHYPDGPIRKEMLDIAREASRQHAKVDGATHYGDPIMYMPSSLVEKEIKYQDVIHPQGVRHTVDLVNITFDMLTYRSHLVDGRVQRELAYLRGLDEGSVLQALYTRLTNSDESVVQEKGYNHHFPYTRYSGFKEKSESDRVELVKALAVHNEALKAVNTCKHELQQVKDKETKAELNSTLEHLHDELREATKDVLRYDAKSKPDFVTQKFFELSVNQKNTVKQLSDLRKIAALASPGTAAAAPEDVPKAPPVEPVAP